MYLHVCLSFREMNSTTKLVFKWLSVFDILLILEDMAFKGRAGQAEGSV